MAAATTSYPPKRTSRLCGRISVRRLPPWRGFPPRQGRSIEARTQHARDVTKAHGRKETRTMRTTTLMNDYLADWPGIAQVYWLRRERTYRGQTSVEDEYGITSLDRDRADAAGLLHFRRTHWRIENGLHYVRDVTLVS